MDPEQKKEFIEALDKYYELKETYEIEFTKMKNKIISTKGLSWKEKRRLFVKTNPPCINCKRPVKTIFHTLNNNDLGRQLIAKCGDKREPCPLNIVINLGSIINLKENILSDKNEINIMKKKIIREKNDLLFNYITPENAVEKFDQIKESIEGTTKFYEFLLELYTDIAHNPEREDEVYVLQSNFNINIETIKELIKDFDRTQNTQLIHNVVEIYVNEIIPKIDEIIEKTYVYRQVEYDEYDEKFKLIQIPFAHSIEKMEFDISDKLQQGIVSFEIGMESAPKMKERKTKKNKNLEKEESDTVIVEEEQDQDQDQDQDEKEDEDFVDDDSKNENKTNESESESEVTRGGGGLEMDNITTGDLDEEFDLGDEDMEQISVTSDDEVVLPKIKIYDEELDQDNVHHSALEFTSI